MSVISQTYSLIIDRGISAPGHGKEVVDGLNAVDKHYIYQLMSKYKLPGSIIFDSHIKIHTGTEKKYVSLAREFKDHLEGEHRIGLRDEDHLKNICYHQIKKNEIMNSVDVKV